MLHNTLELQKLSYKLFNAVVDFGDTDKINVVKRPYVFSKNVSADIVNTLMEVLDQEIVLDGDIEATFYETWDDIISKERDELLLEQIVHYWTVANGDEAYVPNDNYKHVIIKNIKVIDVIDAETFVERLRDYVYNITNESSDIVNDILTVLLQQYDKDGTGNRAVVIDYQILDRVSCIPILAEEIKSRELAIGFARHFGILPADPDELIRYIVYVTTDSTLMIKSNEVLDKISRYSNKSVLYSILNTYIEQHSIENLASVFNRRKEYFLAMKNSQVDDYIYDRKLRKLINRISKLSKRHHIPFKEPLINKVLNTFMTHVKLVDLLNNTTTNKLVAVYNTILNRENTDVLFFRIRNGKIWYKEDKDLLKGEVDLDTVKGIIYTILRYRILSNIKEYNIKFVNVDSIFELAVPTSGKMFVNNIPIGSKIKLDGSANVIGIQWFNTEHDRVDLDLSVTNEAGKIGWNAAYYNKNVTYSGDVTDAPKPRGACEMMLVNDITDETMYTVNVSNFTSGIVGFNYKVFLGVSDHVSKNIMLDPNEIVFSFSRGFKDPNKSTESIGVFTKDYYFIDSVPSVRNVTGVEASEFYKGMVSYLKNRLTINDLVKHVSGEYELDSNREVIEFDFNNPSKDVIMKLFS